MGTSNWQNISYCIDLMRGVDPYAVLDIGVGFGRWGIIAREFLDVWNGKTFRADWNRRIEGVEVFPQNIDTYHQNFYSAIHMANAFDFLMKCEDHYDLIIFGDVLERFTKEQADVLMRRALERSRFVMLNIPLGKDWPQDARDGNEYERHLSEWEFEEISTLWPMLRCRRFYDYSQRLFGVFLFAQRESDRLRFDFATARDQNDSAVRNEVQALRDSLSQTKDRAKLRAEADALTRRTLGALRSLSESAVTIESIGKGSSGKGAEVWLLNAASRGLPLLCERVIRQADGTSWRSHGLALGGEALVLLDAGSRIEIMSTEGDAEISLLTHPWSGTVRISRGGRTLQEIDLSVGNHDVHTVVVR